MDLTTIGARAWQTAHNKGLHEALDPLPLREQTLIRLALVHTEVSEATQTVKRHGVTDANRDDIAEELADTIIRIAEMAHGLGLDLATAVWKKLKFNEGRAMYFGTPHEQRPAGADTPGRAHGTTPVSGARMI